MGSPLPGTPFTFKAKGLSDAADGSNAFPGAMQLLQNLIPDPKTRHQFVPRPAMNELTAFAGFNAPTQGEELFVVGAIAYGMMASARFPGFSEPFAYNLITQVFLPIAGVLAGNLPKSQPTVADWVPSIMSQVGGRILCTHPGFPGGATKFGWLDVSGFTSNTITGNTHTSTLIDTLSGNPIQAGWAPGMTVAGAGVQAGTTIVSLTAASVTLSLPTTASANGVTLTVAGGTAAAPLWGAGDTNGNNLASVPLSVANFNGRAYFAVGPGVTFSDAGNPCQVTNATQAISFQNGLPVTALSGLPLNSVLVGGVIQSLMAFQGDAQIQQITGDPTTNNLTVNAVTVGVGTLAPNSISSCPLGLAFVAPDGLRIIDFFARVGDPIGAYGEGVNEAFLAALFPSRITAAYNQNVLRVTLQNGSKVGQPLEEYWYDFSLKAWSGPHTCTSTLIAAVQTPPVIGQSFGHGFVLFPTFAPNQLWSSEVNITPSSTYVENGTPLSIAWQTCLLPDAEDIAGRAVIESSIGLALPPTGQLNIEVMDEASNNLGTLMLEGAGPGPSKWGTLVWGRGPWDGFTGYFRQYPLNWLTPLVFRQASVLITGTAIAGLSIGNLRIRHEELEYMPVGPAVFQPGVAPQVIMVTDTGTPGVTAPGAQPGVVDAPQI